MYIDNLLYINIIYGNFVDMIYLERLAKILAKSLNLKSLV